MAEVAPVISVNDPVAVAPLAHCHEGLVTTPSGSDTDAVAAVPPLNEAGNVTVPASSTFVRVMVTAIVSSMTVSAVPAASLLSLTVTFTE